MNSLIINILAVFICGTIGTILLLDGHAGQACFNFFLVGMNFTCAIFSYVRMYKK